MVDSKYEGFIDWIGSKFDIVVRVFKDIIIRQPDCEQVKGTAGGIQ